MVKASTKRSNNYLGDTCVVLIVKDGEKEVSRNTLFQEKEHFRIYYTNDINGKSHNSLQHAKTYFINKYLKGKTHV